MRLNSLRKFRLMCCSSDKNELQAPYRIVINLGNSGASNPNRPRQVLKGSPGGNLKMIPT